MGVLANAHAATPPSADTIVVDAAPAQRIQTFSPLLALGSTVDKEPAGSIPSLYSPHNVRLMLGTGLGWLSYRLFTELSSQDWHWNPRGSFTQGDRGYWTSSAAPNATQIRDSYQFSLPHRGGTTDQGNNAAYSRLDDGDPATYWKSDPYLASAFTHEPDSAHPQWVVVDLGKPQAVDALRIAWADPYATKYQLAYWTGADAIGDPGHGAWKPFAQTAFTQRSRTTRTLSLGAPAKTEFVRLLMTDSSNSCDTHGSSDRRNCVGYAIGEISVGRLENGRFVDDVHHAPCGGEKPGRQPCGERQTAMYVSSVDPWHTAQDRVTDQEQPGLDLIARSGLTRGIGGTYPVPMLYSTPENAVAEVRYLRARGYPIRMIELGEEPDGQFVTPEDDAELYVQWARALHRYDPSLVLGGPVFSGANSDIQAWPDETGNVSWLNRFLKYLQAHGGLAQLAFMSFEHYPFDGCEHGAKLLTDLLQEPQMMRGIVQTWRNDGVPATMPMFVTEAGFSAVNFTEVPMQIEGALWLADYFGTALVSGVSGVVYYQYEPVPLSQNRGCPTDWGNLTIFAADRHGNVRAKTAQYFAAQMLTQQWVEPGNRPHELYRARWYGSGRRPLVTAYAVKRPSGEYSVMIVNKDARPHAVAVQFAGIAAGAAPTFSGTVTFATFGSAQYRWHNRGALSLPDPNEPPRVTQMPATATYTIPAQSITVIRGAVGAATRGTL
ncbi:MAG: discoidin domain-containing protein [Candidatus Eremiobacteraeota bacterium]|nr:discoidin domain-containing protein [Candidatus Eremiobacteraeota bacterium]